MRHGMVVAGQQPLVDGSHVWLAALTAMAAAVLLVLSWYLARRIREGGPWAGWASQLCGVAAAVLVTVSLAAALDLPYGWALGVVPAAALLVVLMASRWAPGVLTTLAFGICLFEAGAGALTSRWLDADQGWALLLVWLTVCGILAATVLARFFPPSGMTRGLGLVAWVVAPFLLMGHASIFPEDGYFIAFGRLAALAGLALVVVGGWHFVRESRWEWGIAASSAGAVVVQAVAAALVGAGFVPWLAAAGTFLLTAGVLVAWRNRSAGRRPSAPGDPSTHAPAGTGDRRAADVRA